MVGFDSSKKNFDNLTGNPSNYNSWSESMESYLKTRREWLPVVGRSPEPEFVDVDLPTQQECLDHIEWLETRDSAAGTIFLCIDDSQKDHAGPQFSAYDAFFSIRKEENESLTELTGRVSRAMAHIKSLRPSHFGLQQLDEELQSMALIHALPPDYSSFVDLLFLLDKLTLAGLRSALHNRENQAQLHETFASVPTVAMKASTTSTTPSVICGWCLRTGHAEENCYSKKLSQQHDQNTAASRTKRKSKAEKG
ncbi:hypothetical protein K439DRAFT_1412453, partial [Ramaria rubella]